MIKINNKSWIRKSVSIFILINLGLFFRQELPVLRPSYEESQRRIRNNIAGKTEVVLAATQSLGWKGEQGWKRQEVKALFKMAEERGIPAANVFFSLIGENRIKSPLELQDSIPPDVTYVYSLADKERIFELMRKIDPEHTKIVKIGFDQAEAGRIIREIPIPKDGLTPADKEFITRYILRNILIEVLRKGAKDIYINDPEIAEMAKEFFASIEGKVVVTFKFENGEILKERFNIVDEVAQNIFTKARSLLSQGKRLQHILIATHKTETFKAIKEQLSREPQLAKVGLKHISYLDRMNEKFFKKYFKRVYGKEMEIHYGEITTQPAEKIPQLRVNPNPKPDEFRISFDFGQTRAKVVVFKGDRVVRQLISKEGYWHEEYLNKIKAGVSPEEAKWSLDDIKNGLIFPLLESLFQQLGEMREGFTIEKLTSINFSWADSVRRGEIIPSGGLSESIKDAENVLVGFGPKIREEMRNRWGIKDLKVGVTNDAAAAALGVSFLTRGRPLPNRKILVLPIGTSLGSAMLTDNAVEDGVYELTKIIFDEAPDDTTFHPPWSMNTTSRYVSANAVVDIAHRLGLTGATSAVIGGYLEVGDERAKKVFDTIGLNLAEFLAVNYKSDPFGLVVLSGGVVSGLSGQRIKESALALLKRKYPELNIDIKLIQEFEFGDIGYIRSGDMQDYLNNIGAAFMVEEGD